MDPAVGTTLAGWAARSVKRERWYTDDEFNGAMQVLIDLGADPCRAPTVGPFAGKRPVEIAEITQNRPSTIDLLRTASSGCAD